MTVTLVPTDIWSIGIGATNSDFTLRAGSSPFLDLTERPSRQARHGPEPEFVGKSFDSVLASHEADSIGSRHEEGTYWICMGNAVCRVDPRNGILKEMFVPHRDTTCAIVGARSLVVTASQFHEIALWKWRSDSHGGSAGGGSSPSETGQGVASSSIEELARVHTSTLSTNSMDFNGRYVATAQSLRYDTQEERAHALQSPHLQIYSVLASCDNEVNPNEPLTTRPAIGEPSTALYEAGEGEERLEEAEYTLKPIAAVKGHFEHVEFVRDTTYLVAVERPLRQEFLSMEYIGKDGAIKGGSVYELPLPDAFQGVEQCDSFSPLTKRGMLAWTVIDRRTGKRSRSLYIRSHCSPSCLSVDPQGLTSNGVFRIFMSFPGRAGTFATVDMLNETVLYDGQLLNFGAEVDIPSEKIAGVGSISCCIWLRFDSLKNAKSEENAISPSKQRDCDRSLSSTAMVIVPSEDHFLYFVNGTSTVHVRGRVNLGSQRGSAIAAAVDATSLTLTRDSSALTLLLSPEFKDWMRSIIDHDDESRAGESDESRDFIVDDEQVIFRQSLDISCCGLDAGVLREKEGEVTMCAVTGDLLGNVVVMPILRRSDGALVEGQYGTDGEAESAPPHCQGFPPQSLPTSDEMGIPRWNSTTPSHRRIKVQSSVRSVHAAPHPFEGVFVGLFDGTVLYWALTDGPLVTTVFSLGTTIPSVRSALLHNPLLPVAAQSHGFDGGRGTTLVVLASTIDGRLALKFIPARAVKEDPYLLRQYPSVIVQGHDPSMEIWSVSLREYDNVVLPWVEAISRSSGWASSPKDITGRGGAARAEVVAVFAAGSEDTTTSLWTLRYDVTRCGEDRDENEGGPVIRESILSVKREDTLRGHTMAVTCVAWKGDVLATSSDDQSVRVYSTAAASRSLLSLFDVTVTAHPLFILKTSPRFLMISYIALSPCGGLLAAATMGGAVHVFDLTAARKKAKAKEALAPEGSVPIIRPLELERDCRHGDYRKIHFGGVEGLCFSPQGDAVLSCASDCTVVMQKIVVTGSPNTT